MKNRNEGSGLFVVMIIATALSVGIYSALDLVNGEFQRNKKAALYHEAKAAAEAIIQSSLADLKGRFDNQTAFPVDALSPSRNPLHISEELVKIHENDLLHSHLVIPSKLKATSTADFNTQDTEVIGGTIPPGQWRYIDPRIPGNEFDELAGTRVFERSIEILSKATTKSSRLGSTTVYARQFLHVRDAPLFAYAIFYNLPMEIAPGPVMDVFGNVHSNWDSWFQSNESLSFNSKVTLAGEFLHGRHPDSGQSNSSGKVRISDGRGNLVNMQEDGSWPSDQRAIFGGGWLTSKYHNFYNLSNQLWDGNLQAGRHGVLPQNPVGVRDYIEDTDPSTSAKESFNSAYEIIQPVVNSDELTLPDRADDPAAYEAQVARNEVERQKYAYKAGLTIKVEDDGDIEIVEYRRDSDGNILYDSDGNPRTRSLEPSEPFVFFREFEEDDGDIESGLHDKRQARDLNIVELDVGKLKDLVHSNDESKWGGAGRQRPDRWWNGVVYVEFETQNPTSSRPDRVNPAKPGYGLKLVNGKVIPNPSFAHSSDTYGTSFATNQMLYVKGHFNADGNFNTGSPTRPDSSSNFTNEGAEAPAALIADSITFLSEAWEDEDSNKRLNDRRASHTEVSAAILTGNVPSGETGSRRYSGGVENFPRFLEKWSSRNLRIRGSMVALFESEVGTRGWGYGDVYNPPRRQWGFHEKFAEGYLPPGTPNTRRYRAVDFELVDKDTYEKYVEQIKGYF